MKNNQLVQVNFNSTRLATTQIDGIEYVALRPISDGIGLDWASQTVKLNKNKEKFNCCDITTVGGDGKNRQMLCIPLKKLNGWLFSINADKVRPDLKDKVIAYQEECFAVLYSYWNERKFVIGQLDEWHQQEQISFEKGSEHGKGLCLRKKEKHFIRGNIAKLEAMLQPDLFIDYQPA